MTRLIGDVIVYTIIAVLWLFVIIHDIKEYIKSKKDVKD
jgi:hypothetical protein